MSPFCKRSQKLQVIHLKSETLKDIALQLGLSISTVSRVVNSKGYVKEATRKRVLSYLDSINYVPNDLARSLKKQESMTIGVIVTDMREVYFSRILKEMEPVLAEAGYLLLVADSGENAVAERKYIDLMFQKRVDALVISTMDMTMRYIERYLNTGTPVVFIDNHPKFDGVGVNYVVVDNQQASCLAVQTLIDRGHRDIAVIIGSLEEPTGYERLDGYKTAMVQNNLPVDPALIALGNFKDDGGYRCMCDLLAHRDAHPFTAVHVTSEMMTIGALRAIREHGLIVGRDIAVIGFDVHDDLGMAKPTIATVRQPEAKVGHAVGHLLLQLLNPAQYGNPENTKQKIQAYLQAGESIQTI